MVGWDGGRPFRTVRKAPLRTVGGGFCDGLTKAVGSLQELPHVPIACKGRGQAVGKAEAVS